jgi:hypothetical protein
MITAVDISKGFNKIDHCKIIVKLSEEFSVPGWLLRIVYSYLSNRTLSVRYKSETSTPRHMPGGTGAGTIIGLEIFLILFNGAGPPANPTPLGEIVTEPLGVRKPIEKAKVKWVDDMTICTAVNLKESLVPEDRPVPRPVPYHARTGHRLPDCNNAMQEELDKLQAYTEQHKMEINKQKTKTMICSTRRKWDVMPELTTGGGENIEVVEEMKVVGYILRSDMRTSSNTKYITKRAYSRMWIVRRLKALGASHDELLDVLQKQVLSVLYLGAPAWFCQTTVAEQRSLDRVLRCGLRIIYGEEFTGFTEARKRANTSLVTEQLQKMTEKFARKSERSAKFSQWYKKKPEANVSTRSQKPKYEPVPARTNRYAESPIPQLTALLNASSLRKKK